MSKLTDSQLIVLSAAATREDGSAVAPQKMNRAAASKVGSSLVSRKLMREVRAKTGMPVWREDEKGRPLSLIITKTGRTAIGIEEGCDTDEASARRKSIRLTRSASGKKRPLVEVEVPPKREVVRQPRAGSKQALVIGMLSEKSGATLEALVEATGWLPHTTRAALTGLRRRGFLIDRAREGNASVYRIVAVTPAGAA